MGQKKLKKPSVILGAAFFFGAVKKFHHARKVMHTIRDNDLDKPPDEILILESF